MFINASIRLVLSTISTHKQMKLSAEVIIVIELGRLARHFQLVVHVYFRKRKLCGLNWNI